MAFFSKAAVAYVRPNLLKLSMRRELEKGVSSPGRPDIQSVVELDLTGIGGEMIRMAGRDAPGDSLYNPVVTLFGNLTQAVNERSNNLATIEVEVEIADEGREFDILSSTYRSKLRGVPASVMLVSPNVSSSAYHTSFSGVLDSFRKRGDGDWLLRIRPRDKALLNGDIAKVRISSTDFANADPEVLDEYVPIYLGEWDSFGLSSTGAVSTYRVNTVGFEDLIGLGKYTVKRVYKAGIIQSSGYTVTYPIINGKQFTHIDWASDPSSTDITADISGIGSVAGDGFYYLNYRSGSYQMMWTLANLVYNDWRSGPYYPLSSAPVNVDAFRSLAVYHELLGYESSHFFKDPTKGESALNEWSESTGTKLYWNHRGLITPKPLGIIPDLRSYSPTWLQGDVDGNLLSLPYESSLITRTFELESNYNEADGGYATRSVVSDTEVEERVTVSKQLPWSKASQ